MSYQFPPELSRKVQQRMSTGDYGSEDELLLDAMVALEDVATREAELRTEIGLRLSRAGSSLSYPLDRSRFKSEMRGRY